MSFIDKASDRIVQRGFFYYEDKNVLSFTQINDNEYEGYVQGSDNEPYHVVLNLNNAYYSKCTCPYAQENHICKHMVALYFSIFEEEAEEYYRYLNDDYDEDEDYYDEDDYDYDCYNYNNKKPFEKPIYYDDLLNQFINQLSHEQLVEVLYKELKKDEKQTYFNYLEEIDEKFKEKKDNPILFIDNLQKRMNTFANIRDYDFTDYSISLLSNEEKIKISQYYSNYSRKIDSILMNPKLSVYEDYLWIAKFYLSKLDDTELFEYINNLKYYFEELKKYGIRNNDSKSNVLIAIYSISYVNKKQIVESLIQNAKYSKYIEYIFNNETIDKELYFEFLNQLRKNPHKNKQYTFDVLYDFYYKFNQDESILMELAYYGFMNLGTFKWANKISNEKQLNALMDRIEKNSTSFHKLRDVYIYTNQIDKLYDLINNKGTKNDFIYNIEYLKDKYSIELYNQFKNSFYEMIHENKKREVYREATKYLVAISKLKNGKEMIKQIMNELNNSEYKKRTALFDEIKNALR